MPADADEARSLAEQILSAPEYQTPPEPWWQRALDAVDRFLSRFFTALGGSGGGSVVAWIVVVVVLGLAVAAIVVAVRSWRRTRSRALDDVGEAPPRRRRREPAADWSARADELEAAGRWRDGMLARYRGLVIALTRAHVVDPAASRTTGEHRQEVSRGAPGAAAEFGDAAELFDRAWYGNLPTGPEEAERFRELARQVEEQAR